MIDADATETAPAPATEPDPAPARGARRVHPALWALLATSAFLFLSSLGGWTWGWRLGGAGAWTVLPLLLAGLVATWVLDRRAGRAQPS